MKHLLPGIYLTTPPSEEYVAWPHHCLKLTTTSPTTGAAVRVILPANSITVGIAHEAARHQHKSASAQSIFGALLMLGTGRQRS